MHTPVFVIFALLVQHMASAQTKAGYIVKAGEVPDKVIPTVAKYVFPTFKQGIVYQRNGQASAQRLNYNIMLDEMQFLDNKGDTLTIAEPEMVQRIQIDTSLFYYDKTYLQIIASRGEYKLATRQFFVQTPYRTKAGYGIESGISAITTYTSMGFGGRPVTSLQVDKDVAFQKFANFYISDPFNHFIKADKKAFLTLFAAQKNVIEKYINDNKVNFVEEQQLITLLEFCILQKQ